MTSRKRCLLLGAGWMGRVWIRDFLPLFSDRLEVVGVADVDERALDDAGVSLQLMPHQRFHDVDSAFAAVDADFCVVIVPPEFHKHTVMRAVERRMPILSEKPIADSWQACLDIYAAVKAANLKMQVIQNYRYSIPMLTMRHIIGAGDLGRINYVMARFASDYREYGSWAVPFRHEIPHALLIEGGVHHFDMLRNLSGGDCASIVGQEWNPSWSSSKGAFCAIYTMRFTNDVVASYEGSGTAAGEQNTWYEEYYRVECERGAVSVGRDHIVRIHRLNQGGRLVTEEVPPLHSQYLGHNRLIDEFLTWLDGGPVPATVIDDNIKTMAMVFAAIEASRSNRVVDVVEMLRMAPGA